MVLNILTIIVLIALVALIGFIVVFLGMLPGKIAKKRNHPQSEAINVASWLGIITGGFLWPLTLVWAYLRPREHSEADNSQRLAVLESRIEALEEQNRQARGAS